MIKNIQFHLLDKEQHEQGTIALNPTNSITIEDIYENFLNDLGNAYAKKPSKGYGIFDSNEVIHPMPKLLRNYLSNGNFYEFTSLMMDVLLDEMNSQLASTGGKVFIFEYQNSDSDADNDEYLLIAILKDSLKYSMTDWNVKLNLILDMENLKFAGRINLTRWQAKQDKYISFLKGKDKVSGYFKNFLACNDAVFAKEETVKLVTCLHKFSDAMKMQRNEKTDFLNESTYYLLDIIKKEESFEVETFANKVWPKKPQDLIDLLSDPDDGINEGFEPIKSVVNQMMIYTGKNENWKLSFNMNAVNNLEIEYVDGKIVINHPPQSLLEAFQ